MKDIFGEELWNQLEPIVKEKGLNLILDNKEKPEYIPKSRFDEVISQKNLIKTQVGELTQQLETLKGTVKSSEDLSKEIEALQSKNKDWESKYNQSILQSAIKLKAVLEKAKDADDLSKFLDISKLEISDEGIKGLDDQLKALKESKPYLFETAQVKFTPPNPTSNNRTELEQLEAQWAEADRLGHNALKLKLRNKIFELTKKTGG